VPRAALMEPTAAGRDCKLSGFQQTVDISTALGPQDLDPIRGIHWISAVCR
jgi:hypothetical protein